MNEFIEQKIIGAVQGLLTGQVNKILGELEFPIPQIELGNYGKGYAVAPRISLMSCERTEKERIILLDSYTMTITFDLPEVRDSELFCYAYGGALGRAVHENPTMGGVVDRVEITGKKYVPPKMLNCGEGWSLIVSLHLTVEGLNK